MWNSLEIHSTYTEHGCTILPRSKLIERLLDHFGDDLLVLSGYGVASILVFRSKAPRLLKLVDEDDEINVTFIVKTIKNEFSERSADRETYKTRPFLEDATDACSDLLLKLLAELSPKLHHTNTALLIDNIITSVLTKRPTTLQISHSLNSAQNSE